VPNGYHGKILKVNLTTREINDDQHDEIWYRQYIGGVAMIYYYLLQEVPQGVDAFDPENRFIIAPGPLTGALFAGAGRNAVGAKSPLTGGIGKTEVGGHFGAEVKRAGWDGIVVTGRAGIPVYLWIEDGQVEIRDASHLWGKNTSETVEALREELGQARARVCSIGPAGENLVRFSCINNDLFASGGRSGMGAVMGSKNLKAIACRGTVGVNMADEQRVRELNRWMVQNFKDLAFGLTTYGTGAMMDAHVLSGNLPTRNWASGAFSEPMAIDARTIKETISLGMDGCFACPVRCKKVVQTGPPYNVDPAYGGPEYETLAALGSFCGVSDLEAVCKGHDLCNAYAMDTISAGEVVAFAMECYERGVLTSDVTRGLDLNFGNAEAMVELLGQIARREGLGDILAEGSRRAAQEIGQGTEEYAMQVKGVGFGMHEPRSKPGLGIGYATEAHGADHGFGFFDTGFSEQDSMAGYAELGIVAAQPALELTAQKIPYIAIARNWSVTGDCLVVCNFLPWTRKQKVELLEAVTGWNSSIFDLVQVGERAEAMARAFNIREGLTPADDMLPERFFETPDAGHLKEQGIALDKEAFQEALQAYYRVRGWDEVTGYPLRGKLEALSLAWLANDLGL
jgi:aldehyde:ferredoxin oxidoreductase